MENNENQKEAFLKLTGGIGPDQLTAISTSDKREMDQENENQIIEEDLGFIKTEDIIDATKDNTIQFKFVDPFPEGLQPAIEPWFGIKHLHETIKLVDGELDILPWLRSIPEECLEGVQALVLSAFPHDGDHEREKTEDDRWKLIEFIFNKCSTLIVYGFLKTGAKEEEELVLNPNSQEVKAVSVFQDSKVEFWSGTGRLATGRVINAKPLTESLPIEIKTPHEGTIVLSPEAEAELDKSLREFVRSEIFPEELSLFQKLRLRFRKLLRKEKDKNGS